MNFVTSASALIIVALSAMPLHSASLESFVRNAAIKNGFQNPDTANKPADSEAVRLGKVFFESESLSVNGNISCQTCHLDDFGSADGIPNAVGIGGQGEGPERALAGGPIIPRNTLPLWGRGSNGFDTFFWDGKVDFSDGKKISQFGADVPSENPLLVAVHLPVVEIKEMLVEDEFVASQKTESVASAQKVYTEIVRRLKAEHGKEFTDLADHLNKETDALEFHDVASVITDFITSKFALQKTRFVKFVFEEGELSEQELQGAFLFYGKGKCSVCHSGTLFSDLKFHSVPLGQLGTGKNGFGIDYGRFNVTHDPADLYKFRTPPLLDVTNTAPYGHSGSQATLAATITNHFDPLRAIEPTQMTVLQRVELFRQLAASGSSINYIPYLDEREVEAIVDFLNTLSFREVHR